MFKNILLFSIILSSIFSCQKQDKIISFDKITCAPGPEDIVLDKPNNRILISCNERRIGEPMHSEIQQLNLYTNQCTNLPLSNLPAIPFNPHGFDLQTINGIDYLYVINHYKDTLNTSSILQFKINSNDLSFVHEYKNSLLISPNDLTILPNGSFYFSNDRNSANILELLTNPYAGSVVFCDGNNSWKKVDSAMGFPNGMYNENNKLYVATSRNRALFTYDINSDGSLKNRTVLSNINGMDNITKNGNELIVAVHPDEIKFALLTYFPTTLSPCRTYSIDRQTGVAHQIFYDDGSMISGSSTALVVGDNLYLSQVFGNFILKISNFSNK